MTTRRRRPEPIFPESWVRPARPIPRISKLCGFRIGKLILVILSAIAIFIALFSNSETWRVGVDLIDDLSHKGTTLGKYASNLHVHDSPLGAQTQKLRDHLATIRQAMDRFRGALHDPVWERLFGGHDSHLANPEPRVDQEIRNQFEFLSGALRNMSSKRIDSLDQHRQRYCVEAFTAIYKARKSIKRIKYMFSNDNRQKASRDEVCRLSREHYNLVWILHPKHALIHSAMRDVLTGTSQLVESAEMLLNHSMHCPPPPPAAPPGPDLPHWTSLIPWFLLKRWYKDEVEKQH